MYNMAVIDSLTTRFVEVANIIQNRLHLKDVQFSKSFGMSVSTYNNIKNGRNNISTSSVISFMSQYEDVNGHYLLTGKGKPFFDDIFEFPVAEEHKTEETKPSLADEILKMMEEKDKVIAEKDKRITMLTDKLLGL